MGDKNIAETLRAAAGQLRNQIEHANQKHRRVLLTPDKVTPFTDLLAALADEMDGYGPDEDGRGGPKVFTSRDGTRTVGLDMFERAPTDLPAWTAAWNGARAILGDGEAADTP